MPPTATTCLAITGLLLAAAGAGLCAATTPAGQSLSPDRVTWRHAELEAKRFPFSVSSDVELAVLPTAGSAMELLDPARGKGVAPGPRVVRLNYRLGVLTKYYNTVLWMDPFSGAALQYENLESGMTDRYRVFRYTDEGAYLWTRRPVGPESARPHAEWTRRSEGFRPYGEEFNGQPVTDPVGLLYVVAAAGLAPGGRQEVLVMTGRQVSRVIAEADGPASVDVDYVAIDGGQRLRCQGKRTAGSVRLRVEPAAGEDPDFDFLGLRSDIRLLLDPPTGLPLEISGRAKLVGFITIRLREATLAGGASCQ